MKLIDPPYKLTLPELFHDLAAFAFHPSDDHFRAAEKIAALFPLTANNPLLKGGRGKSSFCALRVGALFSGGPAPGGHRGEGRCAGGPGVTLAARAPGHRRRTRCGF